MDRRPFPFPARMGPRMKKIPLVPADTETPESHPQYLADALEILLLGGIWLFVLVMLPVIQSMETRTALELMPDFAKAFGIVTTALSLWVGGMRWFSIPVDRSANAGRETVLLIAIAIGGVVAVCIAAGLFSRTENLTYVFALQAILGLGYFMARRLERSPE